mgnify:FL=1
MVGHRVWALGAVGLFVDSALYTVRDESAHKRHLQPRHEADAGPLVRLVELVKVADVLLV